jgi:hypothetical protein
MMRVSNENGCIWITHSKYYYQSPASLPFAPQTYWNVITNNDVIPVCTYGYKTLKSAQSKISSYVSNVKEIKLIHIETEEEHRIQNIKYIRECMKNSIPNPYL